MVFNAGTHTDAIRMHYLDFADVAHPIVGVFGCLHASRVAPAVVSPSIDPQECA
jgi:hypothetical protein